VDGQMEPVNLLLNFFQVLTFSFPFFLLLNLWLFHHWSAQPLNLEITTLNFFWSLRIQQAKTRSTLDNQPVISCFLPWNLGIARLAYSKSIEASKSIKSSSFFKCLDKGMMNKFYVLFVFGLCLGLNLRNSFRECIWIEFGSVGLRQGSELALTPNIMYHAHARIPKLMNLSRVKLKLIQK